MENYSKSKRVLGEYNSEIDAELVRDIDMHYSKEEGKAESKYEIAKNMLKDKLSINMISKYTGLTSNEIKNIQLQQ